MTRTAFKALVNNSILEFADRLENYGNEIADVVENRSEVDYIDYTHKQFELIDDDFLGLANSILTEFTEKFDEDSDKELMDYIFEQFDNVKNHIIEMKYDIANILTTATRKTFVSTPKHLSPTPKRYIYQRKDVSHEN